jgi:glutamate-ammonia-ligase adenylyltransferase
MKPDMKTLKSLPPDAERLLAEHLSRLDERYFKIFSEDDLHRHFRALASLSPDHPVEVLLNLRKDGTMDCTVLAFDYPSEFSMITGILAGMGFNILSGDVFTYEGVPGKIPESGWRPLRRSRKDLLLKRRRIIDHFTGTVESSFSPEAWTAELKEKMSAVTILLEQGDEPSVVRARHQVNEMVVSRLFHFQKQGRAGFYPVEMEVDNTKGPFTRLKVVSEDTPAFLYALSNALTLKQLSIEGVKIRTIRGRIEDTIDLVDYRGERIEDPELLNQLKLSVLLTKQFTYFLGGAPDPFNALSRFEHLAGEVLSKPEQGQWLDLLTNPRALQDLARLLGASDFLWEDFIRLQYETLLPSLKPYLEGGDFTEPVETLGKRISLALKGAGTPEEMGERLNAFKDREIFLMDLDQILRGREGFELFSERLTRLAEAVLCAAASLTYGQLVERHGRPRSIAGLEAKYAILGLGKLGGAALGYASDLELLFVYSDKGQTDGDKRLENSEFFDLLVKGMTKLIKAKREGIFQLDLRLRPYGNAGPLASSLEGFCRYYGPRGDALSYERIALVRLRAIGGDSDFGRQLERLRDEMIYFQGKIDLEEFRDLRERQFKEKTEIGRLNAKYSPGGLVDLEYSIQIFQVRYGGEFPQLRTPILHEALGALADAGVLSPEESFQLISAYGFLRRLINSMRMLRGSAKDLFLPAAGSDEYAHLARRMGYERGAPLNPEDQLRIELENHTAAVRIFIENYFGRESLPGPGAGSVVDLILSEQMPPEIGYRILRDAGFQNWERAYVNLKELAGSGERRNLFARLSLLAFDILSRKPDPDMALNNWERFIHSVVSAEFHYRLLLSQPMRLDILLSIFSGSQFLSDTLIRNPGFLDWLVTPELLHKSRDSSDLEKELREAAVTCATDMEWLNKIRRLRRREILRIGARDMYLKVPTQEIMLELSRLADSLANVVLEEVFHRLGKKDGRVKEKNLPERFCVLALGKLGGSELNYSSDIDLLGLWDDRQKDPEHGNHLKAFFGKVMERFSSDLSAHTEEGYVYRVDLRLRPFGREGDIVSSLSSLVRYYDESASLWEIQAALKMRPIAGNRSLGYRFFEMIQPVFLKKRSRPTIVGSIEKMRQAAIKAPPGRRKTGSDVKSGTGGIRDVEFLVQGLQLIHVPEDPSLFHGNTLIALELLREAGVIPEKAARSLRDVYLFLRQVEHCLQILEDRQVHAVPIERGELNALSKRLSGIDGNAEAFAEKLDSSLREVRSAYTTFLLEEGD